MSTPVKWAAELAHVREVSILGTADLAYWKDLLARENLLPAERAGQAQILIISAAARFWGVRFRELSFSVLVACQEEEPRQAAYLLHAFNSCRLFAFCERAFFSTPYYHGDVRVSPSLPLSIRLIRRGDVVFQARQEAYTSRSSREPSARGDSSWEGPVFLPGSRRGRGCQGNLFFARLRGYARTYPFLTSEDVLTVKPAPRCEVLQALLDSGFVAKEWSVREDATHAKSRTYKRAEVSSELSSNPLSLRANRNPSQLAWKPHVQPVIVSTL